MQRCFENWQWTGNIRELRNVLEKAAISTETKRIDLKDLPPYLVARSFETRAENVSSNTNILRQSKQSIERSILESTLEKNNWNKSRAAKQLGISRPLVYSLIKKYKLAKNQNIPDR